MPLLNISIRKTRTQKYIDKLSKTIHQVLVDTWDIPHNDYFHIIHKSWCRPELEEIVRVSHNNYTHTRVQLFLFSCVKNHSFISCLYSYEWR